MIRTINNDNNFSDLSLHIENYKKLNTEISLTINELRGLKMCEPIAIDYYRKKLNKLHNYANNEHNHIFNEFKELGINPADLLIILLKPKNYSLIFWKQERLNYDREPKEEINIIEALNYFINESNEIKYKAEENNERKKKELNKMNNKKNLKNKELRKLIYINDLTVKETAEALNICERTLLRRLNKDLTESQKEEIIKAITKLSEEKINNFYRIEKGRA